MAMSTDEARRRRLRLACRQGGRSAARSRLAAEFDREPIRARDDRGSSTSSRSAGPRAARVVPAGYRSSSPSSHSSLSSGGLTDDTDCTEDPGREYAFHVGGWDCMPDLTGVEATPVAAAAAAPLDVPAPEPQNDPPPHEGHRTPEPAEAAAEPPAAAPDLAAQAVLEANRMPDLEPPQISTRELAGITADALGAYPSSPVDVVQSVVQERLRRLTAPQRRTVDLAVDFGCELLREMSAQLARNMADHFRQLPEPPSNAVNLFLLDQLGQWNQRPLRPCAPRAPEPDVEADVVIDIGSDSNSDSSNDSFDM